MFIGMLRNLEMENIKSFVNRQFQNIINDTKRIVLIKSPPFKEGKRIKYLQEYITDLGYSTIIDKEGNLIVEIKGNCPGLIVFSSHVDTVFPEDTKLKIIEEGNKIFCPGIADNAIGIVASLYLLKYIKITNTNLTYHIVFIFNVGEEGDGNLRGIRYFFDNYNLNHLKAHICIEGHNIGRLTVKAVGSHRRNISLLCEGGHSWRDYGKPNSIIEASKLIVNLSKMKLPQEPKSTINIGTIKGGSSVNSIPDKTEFSLELRSVDKSQLSDLIRELDDIIRAYNTNNVKIEYKIIGDRPCGELKNDKLANLIKNVHNELGIDTIDDIGSTDSNYPLSMGYPSVTIGITKAYNTHSLNEYLEIVPIKYGIIQLIRIFFALQQD